MTAGAEDTLKLPRNTKIIDRESFYGAQSISKVELSGNVTEIRSRAFANSSLKAINLPGSISYIAEDAFDLPDEVVMTAAPNTYAYNWAIQHDYSVSPLIDWASKISIPTASEIAAHNKTTYDKGWNGRSPYIGFSFFGPSEGFTECAIDFRTDHDPDGTYYAINQWGSSMGSLTNVCSSFEEDLTTGYAGFQVADGKHVVIMSIWDTFCVDGNGNRINRFRPNIIYPDVSRCKGNGTFGDDVDVEGTGTGCIYEFDWKVNHPYRALFQQGQAPNGNTTIIFWVQDLETKQWYYLFEYEINRTNTHMDYGGGFLENFGPALSGDIRSMAINNIRVRSVTTRQWVGIKDVHITQFFDLLGSYNFGTDGSAFWAITTGVPYRGSNPEGQWFSVQHVKTDELY